MYFCHIFCDYHPSYIDNLKCTTSGDENQFSLQQLSPNTPLSEETLDINSYHSSSRTLLWKKNPLGLHNSQQQWKNDSPET
jgi:hypothetical protein